jgi:HEAT repeats
MKADRQLDLFNANVSPPEEGSCGSVRDAAAWETLDSADLAAILPDGGITAVLAWAAEIGRRRLPTAIPRLATLCRRFAGFGADRIVQEQAGALDALAQIGGPAAQSAVAELIAKDIFRGPSLQKAVAVAARLGAKLPAEVVLTLLRHGDPQTRADACRCVRASPETIPILCDLLDDLHAIVRKAAACALGRLGWCPARPLLARYLREDPSEELIDATAGVADEDCVILLGRVARTVPDLSEAALAALDQVDHPRAEEIAAAVRESRTTVSSAR